MSGRHRLTASHLLSALRIVTALLLMQHVKAAMAYEFYVTVDGTKQGRFKGESKREQHAHKLAGLSFSYEVSSPRDASTGQATGKRRHGPVTFTKAWGAATPQLFQALVTNEVLRSVLFEFVRSGEDGTEQIFQTIRLTNVGVAAIKQYVVPEPSAAAAPRELEDISLAFQIIDIEHKLGGTIASDDRGSGSP
jgi:type VI secretion system secreted protein Hcp